MDSKWVSEPQLLISVCIPAFRAEKYLRETLDSVAAQSWTNWEIVVVEDGSQDRTESIVRDFAATVSQVVRFQRQEKNRGLPHVRNVANTLALGEWIAFLDADDLWKPEHLESCVQIIRRESPGMVFSGCTIFDSDTGAVMEHRIPTPEQWRDFPFSLHRGEVIIQPSSVVICREALNRTGPFDTRFPICNDLEYWIRACRSGVKIAFTGVETVAYRKHPAAMSSRSADLIAEVAQVHYTHRDWQEIPLRERRIQIRDNFLNAARINRRSRPFTACKQVISGLLLPLFTPRRVHPQP